MNLFCVGLSHHTADVGMRERFVGNGALDRVLREEGGCAEALLLATCNRVEVYAAAEAPISTAQIARCLMGVEIAPQVDEVGAFYRYEALQCVQHLFRVASGLDSMVVGETEILGQTKKAYETARASGGAGPFLHRLFQRAFRVAKQVRTFTDISRGSVSVGSIAVDLAEQIFGNFEMRRVLLLGAGEASELAARALLKRGVRDIRVTNRSPERAAALAERIGGFAVPIEDWENHCREVDILITSTSATTPIVTGEKLAPLLHHRLDRPLFIIDIAVPRDVAADVNEMEGVFLYDIDSLQSIAEQSLSLRRQQIAAGEEIIADHVEDFSGWFAAARERMRKPTPMSDAPLRVSES